MNAVVIIAPNKDHMLKMCLHSVERFAKKHGAIIEVVNREAFNMPITKSYNYKIFEKFQADRFVDQYDRILRIDVDIVFSPDCPDIFSMFDEDKIWVSYEDTGAMTRVRRQQIQLIQETLGAVRVEDGSQWSHGYFNAGVILSSKKHNMLYRLGEKELKELMKLRLGKFKEQNIINWRVHHFGYHIGDTGIKYNHLWRHTKVGHDPHESFIVHFAGKQQGKIDKMKELYKYWYG